MIYGAYGPIFPNAFRNRHRSQARFQFFVVSLGTHADRLSEIGSVDSPKKIVELRVFAAESCSETASSRPSRFKRKHGARVQYAHIAKGRCFPPFLRRCAASHHILRIQMTDANSTVGTLSCLSSLALITVSGADRFTFYKVSSPTTSPNLAIRSCRQATVHLKVDCWQRRVCFKMAKP